jgi:hypothetical protein
MSEGKQIFKIIDQFLARITVTELGIRGWLKGKVHFEEFILIWLAILLCASDFSHCY